MTLPTSAEHVKAFRDARDWTQAEAASWYGVSVRTWRRYERNETRVPAPLLKRLASTRVATVHRVG